MERQYGTLAISSERWMSNDHFGMSVFYRFIWKIIVNIFEEAHNYFTGIA